MFRNCKINSDELIHLQHLFKLLGAKYSYNWMSFPAGNVHDVDDEVPPGWSHTYTWGGWYQSGPGMDDDECVPWVFHSHASNVQRDIHSGPVGVVLVCNPNRSAMQGRSKL